MGFFFFCIRLFLVAMSTLSKYFSSNWLFTEVDNSPLVLFRVFFGFLCAAEAFGAIITGWVRRVMVEPEFTFSFIGLEWLQPLPGNGMYYYFAVMGTMGILIMLGLHYRFAATAYFLMWTSVYLMQKSAYNNHYYLLVLLTLVMAILPAHRRFSLDVKFGRVIRKDTCPRICQKFFVFQVGLVYLFASINKIYPDWLNAIPIHIWFTAKRDYWLIGPLLNQNWFQYVISYGGIFYDGLIIVFLLNRRTRFLALILTLIFNLFNSAVFHIGIFPYMMIAFLVFFYPPEEISKLFFRKRIPAKEQVFKGKLAVKRFWYYAFFTYVTIQIALPLRHWLFHGDVHWSEEGHRMAWQMMLRTKSGSGKFIVKNNDNQQVENVYPRRVLPRKQANKVLTQADFMWQYARRLEAQYKEKGWTNISVYTDIYTKLNGGTRTRMIEKDVDLLTVEWDRFKKSDWITPFPLPREDTR
jgi:vitamin K-dependent gamma-carboxylase